MAEELEFDDPKQLLQVLIANWPVEDGKKLLKSDAEKKILKARYSRYLDDNFDVSDFVARINSKTVTLSDAMITGKFAKILVRDPLGFHLAILRQVDHNHWRLSRLTFQCVTCFGVGVYGDEICNVCGGTGWGTTGDLEFCVPSLNNTGK